MAKFITFNGVDFFNSEKIEKISVHHREKNIGDKVYLYFIVTFDGKSIFESDDYKVTEGQFSIPNGLNDFNESIKLVTKKLTE